MATTAKPMIGMTYTIRKTGNGVKAGGKLTITRAVSTMWEGTYYSPDGENYGDGYRVTKEQLQLGTRKDIAKDMREDAVKLKEKAEILLAQAEDMEKYDTDEEALAARLMEALSTKGMTDAERRTQAAKVLKGRISLTH